MNTKTACILKNLYALTDYARRRKAAYSNYSLEGVSALSRALGNPHAGLKTVHVAGTKGKGSVCWFLQSIARAHGLKTGLYLSPHLIDERERISINGVNISWQKLGANITLCLKTAEKQRLNVTVFDVLTVSAFLHFKKEKVDLAFIETGLGGRLDSTNIIGGGMCVLTRIALDHTQQLGNTISAIAAEKAGIIKQGCTVIAVPQTQDVLSIFRRRCSEVKAAYKLSKKITENDFKKTGLPLYQRENAAASVTAAQALLPDFNYVRALRAVSHGGPAGRYSRFGRILIDAAHNPYALKMLVKSIRQDLQYKNNNFKVFFYILPDKDAAAAVKEFPPAWQIFWCPPPISWLSAEENELTYKIICKYRPVEKVSCSDFEKLARRETKANFLITGSFSLAAALWKSAEKLSKPRRTQAVKQKA